MTIIHTLSVGGRREAKRGLWVDQDGRCAYCGLRFARWKDGTLDHYVPLGRGGLDGLSNLRFCCQRCNNAKGELMPDDPVWLKTVQRFVKELR